VKCVDLHPTEQWMLASLYNGNVHVWNHESQQLVKSFEVCRMLYCIYYLFVQCMTGRVLVFGKPTGVLLVRRGWEPLLVANVGMVLLNTP
jgi:hypothetical protein